jgi:hypothetical protein
MKLTVKHLGVIPEAGEGQQQITALIRVVTEKPTPPLVEEEASFQNKQRSSKEQK